jgi:aryl-alcohol dehydrogenase-like predicted oxidoreductase
MKLSAMGVEIHARSLFLQGLLLMNSVPDHLVSAEPRLKAIKADIQAAGSTPLAAALGFVLARPEIACALVGVTSVIELEEILSAARRPLPDLDWQALALEDERILTPSLW